MVRKGKYTQEIADEICERLSKGEPLAVICRDAHMPAVSTVWSWEKTHEGLAEAIARARLEGYDAIAAECLEIANTPVEGMEIEEDENGKVTKLSRRDMLGHRKLQIETRLKLLAKWDPRRYGERLDLGNAEDKAFKVESGERAARVAQLIALAEQRKAAAAESEDDDFDDIV